jgi:hypothetical protein
MREEREIGSTRMRAQKGRVGWVQPVSMGPRELGEEGRERERERGGQTEQPAGIQSVISAWQHSPTQPERRCSRAVLFPSPTWYTTYRWASAGVIFFFMMAREPPGIAADEGWKAVCMGSEAQRAAAI